MEHCPEHSAHDRAIRDHDKQFEEADRQFAATGEQINAINETLAALREIERQNPELIDAMGERVDALENVPADRWNKVVDYALTCVLGIAIGFMASNIGLSKGERNERERTQVAHSRARLRRAEMGRPARAADLRMAVRHRRAGLGVGKRRRRRADAKRRRHGNRRRHRRKRNQRPQRGSG